MFLRDNTLVFMYKEWLEKNRDLTETTLYSYVNSIETFLSESKDIYNLEDYNNFLIKRAIKGRGTYHYTSLKFFIKSLPDLERIEKIKLIDGLIKPKKPSTLLKERKYLSESVLLKVINSMKEERNKIVGLIQYLTGLRVGDVFRIKRGNIIPELYQDLPVLKIVVEGKGRKRAVVFIHDEISQQLIINFIIKNFCHIDYYFAKDLRRVKGDSKMAYNIRFIKGNYRKYLRDLNQALDKNGIDKEDFSTHDYRRCFARRVWTKFKDLQVLQDLLNHSNPATTMLYLRTSGLKMVDYQKQMQK